MLFPYLAENKLVGVKKKISMNASSVSCAISFVKIGHFPSII